MELATRGRTIFRSVLRRREAPSRRPYTFLDGLLSMQALRCSDFEPAVREAR
jgi:hypothetical protein